MGQFDSFKNQLKSDHKATWKLYILGNKEFESVVLLNIESAEAFSTFHPLQRP